MKIKKNILVQCLVIVLILAQATFLSGSGRQALEAKIKRVAEGQMLGYKCANLIELNDLAEKFNSTEHAYTIAVPSFVGIPSDKIQAFLKRLNFDISDKWGSIITKHFIQSPAAKQAAIKSHAYPDDFLQACIAFRTELINVFDKFIKESVNDSTNLDEFFGIDGINKLLVNVAVNNERLMVRSTGKEDTPELANAGGNESVANVQPFPRDVLEALRDVVVSYFGEKSLKQRLGADDPSIFVPEAFTPVLIQRMIGESAGQLPKCGVMFTEEAEGGISRYHDKGDTDGRIQTTDICIIQAAYGHNEGVVNSLIPVDTFYVDQSRAIYPVIRPKTHRMKPVEGETIVIEGKEKKRLTLAQNDPVFVNKPSLSKEAVLTLKAFAKTLEDRYLRPMDVEFVVNEQEKIIYVVQARPIVHKQGLKNASYIIEPEKIKQTNIASGQSIGVAGGSLRLVIDKGQIIVAKDIGQALAMYQDQVKTPDINKIECIIVGKMAPTTSHEATTFRSEGKPVVCIEQYQDVENWLKRPVTIVVSPQQGLVIKWPDTWANVEKGIDGLIKRKVAIEGWINYPIPERISLSSDFVPTSQGLTFDQIIQSLLPVGKNFENFLKKPDEKIDLSRFITTLKKGSKEEAAIALADILFTLRSMLKQAHGADIIEDASYQRRIRMLGAYAIYCARQVGKSLDASPDDKFMYPQRLFAIRFLESVLFQAPRLGEIEDGMISAERVLKGLAAERDLYAKLRGQGVAATPQMVKLMRFSGLAMTDELAKSWEKFIVDLVKSGDKRIVDAFEKMILTLGHMDVLPVWLHTSFDKAARKSEDALDVAKALMNEFDVKDEFISQLQDKLALMKSFTVASFGSPKNFQSLWTNFQESLLSWFLSDDFLLQYRNAKSLGKLIGVGIMTKFVNDVFDLSIKAVTGSQEYKVEDKVAKFHTMLKQYVRPLERWITLVPEGVLNYGGAYGREVSVDSYLKVVSKILHRRILWPEPAQDLKLTPGLDTSAFTIGSGMDLLGSAIVNPFTFEDVFIIIHQSLLFILNVLGSDAGIKDITLPPLLKRVTAEFQEKIASQEGKKPNLISIALTKGLITLFYNLQLGDHSLQFDFCYEKKSNQIDLVAKFAGDNMANRWDIIAHFAWLLNRTGLIAMHEIVLQSSGVRLEMLINQQTDLKVLWGNLEKLINASFYAEQDYTKIEKAAGNLSQLLEALVERFGLQCISRDPWVKEKLFKAPLRQGQGFDKSTNFAAMATDNKDTGLKRYGLELFGDLIAQRYRPAFDKAAKAATTAISDMDFEVRRLALKLFNDLFSHSQAFDEAAKAATSAMSNIESTVRKSGLELFIALVGYGQGFDQALKVAVEGITGNDFYIRDLALDLFRAFFKQHYKPAFKEAIKAAVKVVDDSNNAFARKGGVILFTDLVKQNYKPAFEQATQAAVKAVEGKEMMVRNSGIDLLIALLDKNKEVTQGVIKELLSNPEILSDIKQTLSKYLVEPDQD